MPCNTKNLKTCGLYGCSQPGVIWKPIKDNDNLTSARTFANCLKCGNKATMVSNKKQYSCDRCLSSFK